MSVTLASVDFNAFRGAGFAPLPAAGQLDSDHWRVNAAAGGVLDYGGTAGGGTVFGRGTFTAASNPTTGGIYALDRGAGDHALVVQASGSAFVASGTLTLRIAYEGPGTLTALTFDYDGVFRNNENRSSQVSFAYAVQAGESEPADFVSLPALGFATPEALAAGAPFVLLDLPAQTVGVTVNPGDHIFARWTIADLGGSGSRDEVGFDNLRITGTPGVAPPVIAIAPASLALPEGDTGITDFTFTVSRSDVTPGEGSVQVAFSAGAGLAPAEIAGIMVGGVTVAPEDYGAFAVAFVDPSMTSVAIVVSVRGDTDPEADETFTLTLSAPSAGYALGNALATGTVVNDDAALTAISAIQGSGRTSPFAGNGLSYTILGVVTGDFQNGDADPTRNLQGFFVQMLEGDGDPATSDGIFVFQNDGGAGPVVDVRVGDVVRVTGTVSEFARFANQRSLELTETQLVAANSAASIRIVEAGAFTPEQVLAQFAVPLPLPALGTVRLANGALIGDLEPYEGMLVRVAETLTISEMFNLDRFNEFRAILGPQAITFTQNHDPDPAGFAAHLQEVARRTVTVDDGLRVQNAPPAVFGTAINTANAPQMGDSFAGLVGNLRFSDGSSGSAADNLSNATSNATQAYRILPQNAPDILDTQPRQAAPGRDGGDLKVATANLLNFFVTLDAGGATTGPGNAFAPRGANTPQEFARQREKLFTALAELDADVLVLNEVENNGFGPGSAIATLVAGFNEAIGAPGLWRFVDPGTPFLGGDAISVGILYRGDKVALAAGSRVAVLDDRGIPALVAAGLLPEDFLARGTTGGVFDGPNSSRAVLVASLTEIASGETFTLAAVHNKSKSGVGTGLDADALDGAGNWNNQRLLAVQALEAFLKTTPTGVEDPDLLLMGDFNAYARETSIKHLTDTAGFRNLVADRVGPEAFSFVFDGQKGYLDHAFASPSLAGFVRGVHEWHVNAPEADALDYNLDFQRPVGIFDGATPWRYSDHDPLVVNLLLAPALVVEREGAVVFAGHSVLEATAPELARPGDVVVLRNAGRLVDADGAVIRTDGLAIDVRSQGGWSSRSPTPPRSGPQTRSSSAGRGLSSCLETAGTTASRTTPAMAASRPVTATTRSSAAGATTSCLARAAMTRCGAASASTAWRVARGMMRSSATEGTTPCSAAMAMTGSRAARGRTSSTVAPATTS